MKGYWTCSRQSKGKKCGWSNPNRKRTCLKCGKSRPARSKPAHMSALDLPYDKYVKLNGGEFCGICGKVPNGRRLDRDHCHSTGTPRGLLCWACNRQLRTWATAEWLEAAAAYLRRSEGREAA
jgi:hypothetical protein